MRRVAGFIILALFLANGWTAENWPQWRGPAANGISEEKGPPVEWGPEQNIAWKVPLRGMGTSTPIVWGDRVFITVQVGDGPFEQRGRDFDNAGVARKTGQKEKVQFVVEAYRRTDGRLLWEYRLDAQGELQPVHMKHNLASPSCVTDGQLLYAWVGTGQLVALTLDGKLVWSRHLGKEYSPFQILWGHGSSPLLYKDALILLCDHQSAAYLLALDKRTGKQRWKVDRGKNRRAYSTPFLAAGEKGDELIINSSERMDAYDPATGQELWHVGEPNKVPVPTPVAHSGVIYASRGYNSGPYMAVKTGGRGDVSQSHVLWEVKTGAPYVSSLLYYRGLIYMATETGIVSCVDAANGQLLWRERLGGVFSASPVAADGKVYLVNEAGETFVLEAGRELKILARNKLNERTLASPAVSGGQIFLRTDQHLYSIGSNVGAGLAPPVRAQQAPALDLRGDRRQKELNPGPGQAAPLLARAPRRSGGQMEKATFAAGCFWGVEAAFRQVKGVTSAAVGYTGGHVPNPTYEKVCTDTTGHAEAVEVTFDSSVVSYDALLNAFWEMHDPTQRNRQGPDFGKQYRSAIFFHTPEQEVAARASKEKLEKSGKFKRPIATEITSASTFYRAEEYHQRYFEKHGIAYCHTK